MRRQVKTRWKTQVPYALWNTKLQPLISTIIRAHEKMICFNKPTNFTLKIKSRRSSTTLYNLHMQFGYHVGQSWWGRGDRLPWRPAPGSCRHSPEIRVRLEEQRFFLGGLRQAQLVTDLLLAPALDYHVALLEAVREVLRHVHHIFFGALVHQVRFGQDPCEMIRRAWKGQLSSQIHLTPAGLWDPFLARTDRAFCSLNYPVPASHSFISSSPLRFAPPLTQFTNCLA